MLAELQKKMLEVAATRPRYSEGSIAMVFMIALAMGDLDTMTLISTKYNTLDHFDEEGLQLMAETMTDITIGVPMGSA